VFNGTFRASRLYDAMHCSKTNSKFRHSVVNDKLRHPSLSHKAIILNTDCCKRKVRCSVTKLTLPLGYRLRAVCQCGTKPHYCMDQHSAVGSPYLFCLDV